MTCFHVQSACRMHGCLACNEIHPHPLTHVPYIEAKRTTVWTNLAFDRSMEQWNFLSNFPLRIGKRNTFDGVSRSPEGTWGHEMLLVVTPLPSFFRCSYPSLSLFSCPRVPSGRKKRPYKEIRTGPRTILCSNWSTCIKCEVNKDPLIPFRRVSHVPQATTWVVWSQSAFACGTIMILLALKLWRLFGPDEWIPWQFTKTMRDPN